MTVPLGVSSLRVTPTLADGTATVRVNGNNTVSGSQSAPVSLVVGSNSITVLVTAQSGNTKTYTLTVTRTESIVYTFDSASDVAVASNGLTATGNTANLSLNFAPLPGTNLMVVSNTGLNFMNGVSPRFFKFREFSKKCDTLPTMSPLELARFPPFPTSDDLRDIS